MFFYNYQKLVPKGSSIDAHIATIHRVFGQPTLVEIFAALEAEDTPWARIVLARLRQCSPLMLHVTFRLMRMARHFTSLEEALTLDHRLTQCMVEGDELYIGLRARLKDHAEPQWTYASVEEVPNEAVARFFTYRPIQEVRRAGRRASTDAASWSCSQRTRSLSRVPTRSATSNMRPRCSSITPCMSISCSAPSRAWCRPRCKTAP